MIEFTQLELVQKGVAMNQVVKITVWKEDGAWLGFLQDYPDYWTQGKSKKELQEHLKDLYHDIASGEKQVKISVLTPKGNFAHNFFFTAPSSALIKIARAREAKG